MEGKGLSLILGGGMALFFAILLLFAFLGWRSERDVLAARHDYSRQPWMRRTLARLEVPFEMIEKERLTTREAIEAFVGKTLVKPEVFGMVEEWEREAYARRKERTELFSWQALKRSASMGKHWAYGYTPHLDHYATDLSVGDVSNYRDLRFIGRDEAYELLTLTLSRPAENSALLIGNPGIGKKTLLHALARDIRQNRFEERALNDARLIHFDLGEAMAEARSRHEDPKSLLRTLFSEATYAGNVVLLIENVDLYLDPAAENNAADVLNEFLALPSFRIVGTMTTASFHKLTEEPIPAMKYFEAIPLSEPDRNETARILVDFFAPLERERVIFTHLGLSRILEAAERFNWDVPFPERAIDLAQEVLLFWEKKGESPVINEPVVNAFLTLKSGVPQGEVGAVEKEKLLNLEDLLHERIIGQHEAVRQLAESFRKARAGLGNAKKPVGSFLFLGPTGVGKTETAKALAAVYFGDEERMVRMDMSEFQSQESVEDLIGSAENQLSGRMTSLVKEHPFSILLLDEIDKAHPRVLDIFLQILDEGYVTDDFGNKVNFRNLIIIATSNAGANLIHAATEAGESMQALKDTLIESIIEKNVFRPEFLNRFDGVILFNSLTLEEITRVTTLKLEAFARKVEEEKKIRLIFGPDVVAELVKRGYQPEFGVRSINRYISDVVEDRIVKRIIEGSLLPGGELTLSVSDIL